MNWTIRDMVLVVAAVLVFVAPIFGFCAAKSVVTYPPYPYLSAVLTWGLWVFYAMDWDLVRLWWQSVIGAGMEALYVLLFLVRSNPADHRPTSLRRFAVRGAALFAAAITLRRIVPRSMLYGIVCCVASCAASIAPLYNVPRAYRERNMELMPSVFIPIFTLTYSVLWISINTTMGGEGWKEVDRILLVASVVAGFCALVQLALHVQVRRLQREDVANAEEDAQLLQETEMADLAMRLQGLQIQ